VLIAPAASPDDELTVLDVAGVDCPASVEGPFVGSVEVGRGGGGAGSVGVMLGTVEAEIVPEVSIVGVTPGVLAGAEGVDEGCELEVALVEAEVEVEGGGLTEATVVDALDGALLGGAVL
jgi:hypothetical protein